MRPFHPQALRQQLPDRPDGWRVLAALSLALLMAAVGVTAEPPATRQTPPDTAGPAKKPAAKGAPKASSARDRFWESVANQEPPETMSLRSLFAHMLALAQSGKHLERMERLCDLAARAQNHNPQSPTYGNLKWTWRDAGVTDQNAVEFCMQDGALLWLKHRDAVPEPARKKLHDLIALSIEGCLRHRVPFSYTNIAILNAANLIVLGEAFHRPEVVDEGLRRLDGICLWTWAFGTHEYCSPTYYAVDLGGLQFLQAHAQSAHARRAAVGLLEVFWNDIELNWFPAAEKLGGAHSRSYDYLHGLGDLGREVALRGWLPSFNPGRPDRDRLEGTPWVPPQKLHDISIRQLPREVSQSWGVRTAESRTQLLHPDIALSVAGAAYGSQDVPLAVDLAGDRQLVRCYFIADGREDPYGVKRYETSSARHLKALHLLPFWAAAQRGDDALGLVIYRPHDLAEKEVFNLQSHFVFRRGADEIWLRGHKMSIPAGSPEQPGRLAVEPGDAIVLRYGTAAVGIRLLWARTQDDSAAKAALVDDGNTLGALRLTVDHRSADKKVEAGAALWVRVGSGLGSGDAFNRWRQDFEQARARPSQVDEKHVRCEVPGHGGAVLVEAGAPFGTGGPLTLQPTPYRGVLALDGRELGRPILDALDFAASYRGRRRPYEPIEVDRHAGTYWEAESGLIFPGMVVAEDTGASGGHYVWQPIDDQVPRHAGNVAWPLKIGHAGRYHLWGRVLAPTQRSNSFFLTLIGDGVKWPTRSVWDIPVADTWRWRPLTLPKAKGPAVLDLPAGVVHLELQLRETGTKIDRLFLTPNTEERPRD